MPGSGPFEGLSGLAINSTISQDNSFGQTAEEDHHLASFGKRIASKTKNRKDPEEIYSPSPLPPPPPPSPPPQRRQRPLRPPLPVGPPPRLSKFLKPRKPHKPPSRHQSLPAQVLGAPLKSHHNKKAEGSVLTGTPHRGPPLELGGVALHSPNTPASTPSTDNTVEEQALVGDEVDSVDNAPKQEEEEEEEEEGEEEEDSDDSYSSYDSSPRNYDPRHRHGGTPPRKEQKPEDLGRQFQDKIHCVIYRIECIHSGPKMYLDAPKRVYGDNWTSHYHLTGTVVVRDLATFISSAGSLAYLILRDVECDGNLRWDMAKASSLPGRSKLFWKERIAIIDDDLRSCINDLACCAPNSTAYESGIMRHTSSSIEDNDRDLYEMRFFYHHRQALKASLDSTSSLLKRQVEDLLDLLQETHGTTYSTVDQHLSQGLIHRDHLESLYCPNSIVVSRNEGPLSAYVLRAWPVGTSALTLDCWYWGYDGEFLHRKPTTKRVLRPLKNVVQIRDLELFPLEFATEEEKTTLELRGQKFWSLRYQNLASYDGWDFKREQHYSNEARCVIDYKTYRRFHPMANMFSFSVDSLAPFDRWPEHISHDTILDNKLLILLPPFIHGFFLKEKKWVTLLVDRVGSVTWNKDAFERLVLPKKTKDLVKALVMVRTSKLGEKQGMSILGRGKRDDLIAGKGNGLIMLLHGSPGTGKTLTAESVAEIAEMPLYNVTCGDIGTSADEVEKYLQTVLVLGKAWNCVLLLDEADVFLEERSMSDLERNSLVSVFLRTLEYYDGILILTSNRVGTFDEAFKSRIQVALHYPNLDRVARKKIWKNFFDMMEADEENVNLDELNKHMQELADQDMNGREIRNSLTTARQIALFQNDTLSWEHVEQAITTSRDFKKYLGAVHKHTDDQYARDNELR